jgi:hypothetical protein
MKQIKKHNITTLHFSGTIGEVIKKLKSEVKYYSEEYTNLRIDNISNWDSDGCYYKHILFGDKPETDEEEALRIKQEKESTKWREENDRRQYEALKSKFEKS